MGSVWIVCCEFEGLTFLFMFFYFCFLRIILLFVELVEFVPHLFIEFVPFFSQGDVYAVGGWDGTSRLNSVEKFDFKLQKWKLAAPLVRARSGLSVSVMNNLLYSVGGWDGNHRLGTIEAYLPSENTWSEVTSMRIPRSGHATAVLKPYIYVIGGTSTSKPLRVCFVVVVWLSCCCWLMLGAFSIGFSIFFFNSSLDRQLNLSI